MPVNRYAGLDHRIRLDYVMDAIRRLKPRRVVDLGCGVSPIQDMDFELYVGIDFDKDAVNPSKFAAASHFYLAADYTERLYFIIPFFFHDSTSKFDLAIWSEGPEHTLKHREVFDNIRRLLAPNGYLMLTTPKMDVFFKKQPYHLEHKCSMNLEGLRRLVENHGFEILEIAEVYSRIPEHLIGYHWLFCLATNAEYDPRYVKTNRWEVNQ